jgi:Flp pilus assembly protein TadD
MTARHYKFAICAALVLLTLATYWPAINHEFVNYDDDDYVYENEVVQGGLTAQNIYWAFTSTEAANWHPLTWLSHMLDCQLYGLDAGGHHLSSLILHIAGTLLLFLLLASATGARVCSAVVAALFALHPLHVESVAWIAERKDVLSGLFWMATLAAYVRYAARPGPRRYLPVAILLALGLMAKPMLVSLPLVLLLLDYWPLQRREGWPRLIREKIPLAALAIASSIITLIAQKSGMAVSSLAQHPLSLRAGNALLSYATYVLKMFWPVDLAVLYPHPGSDLPWLRVIASALLLAAISIAACRMRRSRPYFIAGWLWFLVTLVPVIGIVQVGGQAWADRYTYIPYIGLFIAIVWGAGDLLSRVKPRKASVALVAIAACLPVVICAGTARNQLGYWQNSVTLFERTLQVTGDNGATLVNLAEHLSSEGKYEEALVYLKRAHDLNPEQVKVLYDIGIVLHNLERYNEAAHWFRLAIRRDPMLADAHLYLGAGMMQQRRFTAAYQNFSRAAEIRPDNPDAHFNMGVAMAAQQRLDEAIAHYNRALELRPGYARAHYNLGIAHYGKGNHAAALEHLRLAESRGMPAPPGLLERLNEKASPGSLPGSP